MRQREKMLEDYDINNILNALFSRSTDQDVHSCDSSSSSSNIDEEEKQIYDEMHAEEDDLTSGYTTISSN